MNFTPHFDAVDGEVEMLAYADFNGKQEHFREMNKVLIEFILTFTKILIFFIIIPECLYLYDLPCSKKHSNSIQLYFGSGKKKSSGPVHNILENDT